jgi:hypothetical protein
MAGDDQTDEELIKAAETVIRILEMRAAKLPQGVRHVEVSMLEARALEEARSAVYYFVRERDRCA